MTEQKIEQKTEDVEITEVTDYIDGVSPLAAEIVETHLRKGRRHFGSAGAGLTQQAFHPKYKSDGKINRKSARVGISAERKTSLDVREWMRTKPNAVLVDSVHVEGFGDTEVNEETGLIEGGDTDHVLIIGNDVLIIDTKRWKSKRSYSISDKGAVLRSTGQGKPARGFAAGRINIRGALGIWRRHLGGSGVNVFGLICINSEKVFVKKDSNWYKQPFRVITVEELHDFLDRRYEKIPEYNKGRINTELVAKVAVSAIKPYDEFKGMGLV